MVKLENAEWGSRMGLGNAWWGSRTRGDRSALVGLHSLHWLAVVGLCWPSSAVVGLHWPALAVVGLRICGL